MNIKNHLIFTVTSLIILMLSSKNIAQPFSGTAYMDPNIITSSDPSSFQSATYSGRGNRTVYDRRVSGWITIEAHLFRVIWDDGLDCEAQINIEFKSVKEAKFLAEKYAWLVGQLPHCLRANVKELWIHSGIKPFGGRNNSILIYTDQGTIYEKQGFLEEVLIHEASHTSLDEIHTFSSGWMNAQDLDSIFISTYAQENPTREDIAESYVSWLAFRHRSDRISELDYQLILKSIPNRVAYFDSIDCEMYPIDQ